MNHFKKEPDNILQILKQSLWLNKCITVNKKCLHVKSWGDKGINQVKDILNVKCEFLNHEELKQQYNIDTSFLLTLQIQATIPKTWKKTLSKCTLLPIKTPIGNTISINKTYTSLQKITCKEFDWHLINIQKHTLTSIHKWGDIFRFSRC